MNCLTQEELSQELNRKSRHGIKEIKMRTNRFYFETILEICQNHDITITFEKSIKFFIINAFSFSLF